MNEIFNQMMSLHRREGADGERNALYEVMQHIVLCGLYRGGFFNEAAFYGGTCLRIFYGLKRYSEDMDFSLLPLFPMFKQTRNSLKYDTYTISVIGCSE